jgi:D-threo-aldose 1-dehydrogenase
MSVIILLRRRLPGTHLELTEIGFGAASLGNLYVQSTDVEAADAVAEAWLSGIRYFDTAPHYGLGLSEIRLGRALSAYPRGEVVISTKVGRLLVPNEHPTTRDTDMFEVPGDLRREWDFSRDGILRSVEASLDRLQTDRIDILYLHDPDDSGIPNAGVIGAETLIDLRNQGVVGAVGVGSNKASVIAQLFATTDIDTAMLAGRYTLLEQGSADEVFAAAENKRIVIAGVFNSGLLALPRPDANANYNYLPASRKVSARANALADVAEDFGATLPEAAIAFPLRNPKVASVVLGMRTSAEVRTNLNSATKTLPAKIWDQFALHVS